MSGTTGPGADPRLRFDVDMLCECGGLGTITDAAPAGDGWWLVSWWTEHEPGCPGRGLPERSWLIDAEAAEAGDWRLPGLEPEHLPDWPAPPEPWPPARCAAWAPTTGERCRNPAWRDGLCGTHYRMARP